MCKAASYVLAFLFFLRCFSSFAAEPPKPVHATEPLPGVTEEMLDPAYWISLQERPDEIIMTAKEIERLNANIRVRTVSLKDFYGKPDPLKEGYDVAAREGLHANPILPLDQPGVLNDGSLREWLEHMREMLYAPVPLYGSVEFYDHRNALWDVKMKDALAPKLNIEGVPATITREYGVIIRHAEMRLHPTDTPAFSAADGRLDRFALTDLNIGDPVCVLHESSDGEYLFVESPVAKGWVKAEDIAIGSRNDIRALTSGDKFVLARANRVPVYGDPGRKRFDRWLYCSARLPLEGDAAAGYTVTLPVRGTDGSLILARGYLKPDADVSVGYLPYTKRNIIEQIFRLYGTPYGWHGREGMRDCSGTIRALMRCFGIVTGKNPSIILSSTDRQVRIDPSLSREEKMKVAAQIEPVVTVAGNSGHIVLFLGKAKNGMLYFIHQAGWDYTEDGRRYMVRRTTINAADHRFYSIDAPNVFTSLR